MKICVDFIVSNVSLSQEFLGYISTSCSQGEMFIVSWESHLPDARDNSVLDICPAWVFSPIPVRGENVQSYAPADGQSR